MLSVDSELAGRKRKLKGLSLESPIGKADTVNRVESNTLFIAKQEEESFPGVSDLGMLDTVMMSSTWETLRSLYAEKVKLTSDNKVRKLNDLRESDDCIVPMKWGNAHGGKAVTQHRP